MTENELRQSLTDAAKEFLGAVTGSEKHDEIVSVYKPLILPKHLNTILLERTV